MTDTRYSAEELRKKADELAADAIACKQQIDDFEAENPDAAWSVAEDGPKPPCPSCDQNVPVIAMLRACARDAETLAGIRAWLEAKEAASLRMPSYSSTALHAAYRAAHLELDRLSRGDA
jgi:hypothetical protein